MVTRSNSEMVGQMEHRFNPHASRTAISEINDDRIRNFRRISNKSFSKLPTAKY